MDALSVAYPLLKSHEVIDLLIIMLGTNDVKERFNANAACIGAGMERLIQKCKTVDCWGGKEPNILVVAPPRIKEGFHDEVMGDGCVEKSKGVAGWYKIIAERNNVHFLDAEGCEFNQIDFMHLTRKATHSWLRSWPSWCRRCSESKRTTLSVKAFCSACFPRKGEAALRGNDGEGCFLLSDVIRNIRDLMEEHVIQPFHSLFPASMRSSSYRRSAVL